MHRRLFVALAVAVAVASAFTESDVVLRKLTIEQSPPAEPHTFEVRAVRASLSDGALNIDAIDFIFTTNWVPRMVLRYFDKDSDTISAFFGRWALWKVFEYQENTTAGSPGFEPGVDTYVSGYHLWLRGYDTMTYSKTIVGTTTIHKLCTDLWPWANDTLAHPNVTLCIHTSDAVTTTNGTNSSPNKLKFSFYVANYPYVATNGLSRLAIKGSFDSLVAIREMNSSDADYDSTSEDGIALDANTDLKHRVLTSWARTVDVTGNDCNATGSVVRSVIFTGQDPHDTDLFPFGQDTDDLVSSYTYRIVYHSFITNCQPSSILWDPDFGLSEQSADSPASALLPAVSMTVLLLSALAAVFL